MRVKLKPERSFTVNSEIVEYVITITLCLVIVTLIIVLLPADPPPPPEVLLQKCLDGCGEPGTMEHCDCTVQCYNEYTEASNE